MEKRDKGTEAQRWDCIVCGLNVAHSRKQIIGWVLFVICIGIGGINLNAQYPKAKEMVQVEGPDGKVNSADKIEHRGVLLAWALAMVLGGLFVVMFLMAVARSGRFFRRRHRIGVKEKPTEYIDAWSQYRLKDQDWKEAYEDEG